MRTGHKALASPQTPPDHPVAAQRDNDGAAAGGERPVRADPSPPAAAPGPPPSVIRATRLHALRFAWSEFYEVAACVLAGEECWTAVRLDASGIITAADWVTFGVLLREDHGHYPTGGKIRKVPYDLATVRLGHPGFAVIEVPGGYMAFRGGLAWPLRGEDPLRLPVLNNELHAQEWEDKRLAAAAARVAGDLRRKS